MGNAEISGKQNDSYRNKALEENKWKKNWIELKIKILRYVAAKANRQNKKNLLKKIKKRRKRIQRTEWMEQVAEVGTEKGKTVEELKILQVEGNGLKKVRRSKSDA